MVYVTWLIISFVRSERQPDGISELNFWHLDLASVSTDTLLIIVNISVGELTGKLGFLRPHGLLWSTLAHYIPWWALHTVANSDPVVKCSRRVHSVALYDSAKPHFPIRSCHCLCEHENFCKTRCLRWDIKMDGVRICKMWYCCLKILLSKGEHCNNDLAYFHCCL